jgi:hypothetical protein
MQDHEQKKYILVLSHAAIAGGDPFSGAIDEAALDRATGDAQRAGLRFDLALVAQCEAAHRVGAALAPEARVEPISTLAPRSAQMERVLPFYQELGMLPDFDRMASHELIHSVDSLAEAVGWELDSKLKLSPTGAVLVVVFPPITQLVCVYLRSGEKGCPEFFRSAVLCDKLGSCEGYLLSDTWVEGAHQFGHDLRFPPHAKG